MNSNTKKNAALGMPFGTANARLKKAVLFDVVSRHGEAWCYRCKSEITSLADFSIEHKKAWLSQANPSEAFFDVSNIAFSHLSCNVGARKVPESKHGTINRYQVYGCRCRPCTDAAIRPVYAWRKKRRDEEKATLVAPPVFETG